jgi:hypothetical protein
MARVNHQDACFAAYAGKLVDAGQDLVPMRRRVDKAVLKVDVDERCAFWF